MSCIRRLLLAIPVLAALCLNAADKDEKKKEEPRISVAVPFAIATGVTNQIKVRGLNLTNVSALHFPTATQLVAHIKSRGKASVAEKDKGDLSKIGDTQIELELFLPKDFAPGALSFFAITPEGVTNTNQLFVLDGSRLTDEKEPNPGFRKAQSIAFPISIRGVIDPAQDVDVFRFTARAGQKVRVESMTTGYGSMMDPIVTLYDAKGFVLASSDDSAGSNEASVRFVIPRDGDYHLSVMDAHDRGGATCLYLLVLAED